MIAQLVGWKINQRIIIYCLWLSLVQCLTSGGCLINASRLQVCLIIVAIYYSERAMDLASNHRDSGNQEDVWSLANYLAFLWPAHLTWIVRVFTYSTGSKMEERWLIQKHCRVLYIYDTCVCVHKYVERQMLNLLISCFLSLPPDSAVEVDLGPWYAGLSQCPEVSMMMSSSGFATKQAWVSILAPVFGWLCDFWQIIETLEASFSWNLKRE